MKRLLLIMIFSLVTAAAYPDAFEVGGNTVSVPSPQGFVRVTENMPGVFKLKPLAEDPEHNLLAIYIRESDVPAAMGANAPAIVRYYLLKSDKKDPDTLMGPEEFSRLKAVLKGSFEIIRSSVESRSSNAKMLDPHFETENTIAYSAFIDNNAYIQSATTTLMNVAGRCLLLTCYGFQDDLEWTRTASNAWADQIIASNAQSGRPSSLASSDSAWNNIIEKGIIGGILGLLIVLFRIVMVALDRVFSKRWGVKLDKDPQDSHK